MDTAKIKAAADLLLAARRQDISLACLPQQLMPADAAEVTLALGMVAGWKVGAKGPGMPITCAPMPAQCVFAAPHHCADLRLVGRRGIEVEIALRMQHDLPPRAAPYTEQEVVAAVGAVHPAIEIVASRYTDYPMANPLAGLADSLSNGAFIYGPGRGDLGRIDQRVQLAELHFDDREVVRCVGGNPVGDIWPLVTWLANHLAERCGGLKAGQFVTTGSCTGMLAAAAGSHVRAALADLGAVELSFAQA